MKKFVFGWVVWLFIGGCSGDPGGPSPGSGISSGTGTNGTANQWRQDANNWLVPMDEVFDGGVGKDGIPSLENPEFVDANSREALYLQPGDLIIGFKVGDEIRAYPHRILDWHEIVNDNIADRSIAVTYCPLTGTATAWDRMLMGQETTFGVSGLLYQTNLMPYDRLTGSTWSQMQLQCVNGDLIETRAETTQVFETRWDTWTEMFPSTRVLSTNTGYSRSYNLFPYDDYRTNNDKILFPYSPVDSRLPTKERVLGVLIQDIARIYLIRDFGETIQVVQNVHSGVALVIAGSTKLNFAVAYESVLPDGTTLTFEAIQDSGSTILADNEGNQWNVFGEAVDGPRKGEQLGPTELLIGYWFTFGSFYPSPVIHRF